MTGRRLLGLAVAGLVALPGALGVASERVSAGWSPAQSDDEPQPVPTAPGPDPVTDVPLLVSPPPAVVPLELPAGSSTSGVEERTATQQVFLTESGSRIVETSAYPRFTCDDRSDSWAEIDPSIAPVDGESGVVGSVLGDWSVSFGPLESDGFRIETPVGDLQVVPRGATGTPRVVDGDDRAVRYAGAWPGVDLAYSVSESSVREEIVLFDRAAPLSFVFDLRGATVRAAEANAGLVLDGPLGELLNVAPLVVFDPSGASIEAPVTMVGLRQLHVEIVR